MVKSQPSRRAPSKGLAAAVPHAHWIAGLTVWIVCTLYLGLRADAGWIPHDEGTIGQAAVRTIAGELPHRDFDELYSGGLTLMHAAAFELLGVRLTSLRWVLLVFSIAFVPALYRIAARAAPAPVAACVTLACISWTLPNYFASLPSWYNLFFATFGTLALERYADTNRRAWLFAAGVSAGLSFAFKSVGIYFLAAGLLFLVHDEQERARERRSRAPIRFYRWFVAFGLSLFAGLLAMLVSTRPAPMELLHFTLPGIALVAFLLWKESKLERAGEAERWRHLLGRGSIYLAGAAVVVACFAAPFIVTGSLGALIDGIFVAPQKRLQFAVDPLPPPWTLVAVLPLAVLLVLSLRPRAWRGGWLPVALVLPLLGAVLVAGHLTPVYRAVWFSVRPALPLVVLAGLLRLLHASDLPARKRQTIFLLCAVAALVGLVQFPFSFGLYFCYSAAPIVLALLALMTSPVAGQPVPRPLRALQLGFLVFYLAFPLLWMHRADPRQAGVEYRPIQADTRLGLPRAGLRVERAWVEIYEPLVAEIQRHSQPGSHIYAYPDAPEVYYLSGRLNPTRAFFDFFDEEPARSTERLAALVEEHEIDVVVLNGAAHFSAPVSPPVSRFVRERFPHERRIGPFVVAWRERVENRP